MTKKFWIECVQSKQIKKRILFTIGIVAVYKLGYLLPIPGIDISAISEIQARINSESSGSIFKVMNQFSGGVIDKANIFTLGLMPYLSACLLLQVAGVIIRPLRKHFFSGQSGREKVVRYSLGLSLLLCTTQAYFLTLWLENPNVFMGISIVHNPGWMFRIIGTLTMVTGFCLILWLANLITDKGIGQGVAHGVSISGSIGGVKGPKR
ncbi:hypothetical protein IID62_08285 [candidate division KSB1 bacterium]|nr:hypothetical protein [candidate division KSB1 bacterium]